MDKKSLSIFSKSGYGVEFFLTLHKNILLAVAFISVGAIAPRVKHVCYFKRLQLFKLKDSCRHHYKQKGFPWPSGQKQLTKN